MIQFARNATAKLFSQYSEPSKDVLLAMDSGSVKDSLEIQKAMSKIASKTWQTASWMLFPNKQKDLELRAVGRTESFGPLYLFSDDSLADPFAIPSYESQGHRRQQSE